MSFRSVPSFGIDSSVNLGMPRNEHFFPRNNGNHFESIPRNFFGTKFRCQPYATVRVAAALFFMLRLASLLLLAPLLVLLAALLILMSLLLLVPG